jgi:hypothetical protein
MVSYDSQTLEIVYRMTMQNYKLTDRPHQKTAETKGTFHEAVIHILKISPCPERLIDF